MTMYQRMNRTWLSVAFILSAILLLTHLYALQHYLYWHYRWFDIPMHIIGGAALGSFLFAFGTARRTSTYFACMFAIFVGWEIFEYFAHISTGQPHYWLDTMKDIADGLIGSSIPLLFARKTSWR